MYVCTRLERRLEPLTFICSRAGQHHCLQYTTTENCHIRRTVYRGNSHISRTEDESTLIDILDNVARGKVARRVKLIHRHRTITT